jgi:hypothetical protein
MEEEEGEAREDMDVVVDRTTAIAHSRGASMSALDDTCDCAQSQILVNESSDAAYTHMQRSFFLLSAYCFVMAGQHEGAGDEWGQTCNWFCHWPMQHMSAL